jgi:hypothetical protein
MTPVFASRALHSRHASRPRLLALAALASSTVLAPLGTGCGGGHPGTPAVQRVGGQSDFVSAPPAGRAGGNFNAGAGDSTGAQAPVAPGGKTAAPARTVEETDIYRYDAGTQRLYFLNAYRGLMVFDVSSVDHPKLLGRSPIYGSPVEMVVRGNLAVVVVADWYGTMADGSPFHGSIVRGLDATDPTNIKSVGEAQLGGWVRDTRVVTGGGSDVLYAVSEDYGWDYGWDSASGDGVAVPTTVGPSGGAKVIVSSVSFAGGVIKQAGYKEFPGYGGVFNVTPTSIMFAHDVVTDPTQPWSNPTGKTELQYVDITDFGGKIVLRGAVQVNTRVQGWGADNGRWHLDFSDGKFARALGCGSGDSYWSCGGAGGTNVLSTADFSDPDHPKVASELTIASSGWSPAARFDGGRMYLSPDDYYGYSGTTSTPIQIFDVTSPTAPALVGQTSITGSVWNFFPAGNRLFALGSDYGGGDSSSVALRYLDVTDATKPSVIGVSTFGSGWAWTPAADTFKAFTRDDAKGLVVIPFSGWSYKDYQYNNGVQLIEYTPTSITTKGAAHARGWIERGIFVNGRLLSLSDLSLSVVDYADHANPKVVNELVLARNVVDARPQGSTIAMTSTDWWGNDQDYSELIVRDLADAEENKLDQSILAQVKIAGTDARVFRNGDLAYVATHARQKVACDPSKGYPPSGGPGDPSGTGTDCWAWTDQVQVVDLSGGKALLRGKVSLPAFGSYDWWYWGWGGCSYYDWFDGDSIVQVDGDAIAFRRWQPSYTLNADGSYSYEESKQALFVVDLKNPDAPGVASTTITNDPYGWWGNVRAVGSTLYTTHYEWIDRPDPTSPSGTQSFVKYYLDRIDLTDRAHPKVGAKINVPGVLVGASPTDPNVLYTIDYRWYGDTAGNDLAVVQLVGDTAFLQSNVAIDGWVGKTIVDGAKAYMSAQVQLRDAAGHYTGSKTSLHEVDLSNPLAPVDRASSDKRGWGWLLGVAGDRALVTSGFGQDGVDVYKLSPTAAPTFEKFVRTRGWWTSSLARQDDTIFLSSGYWGVQTISLK